MRIVHSLDAVLFRLFDLEEGNGTERLLERIGAYYSVGGYSPRVEIVGNTVVVDIDTDAVNDELNLQMVVGYAETGNYVKAKALLDELLAKERKHSEYYRIYGQMLSDEGEQEKAINYLIDALKWNPKNTNALIMMGNIYIRNFKDTDTGLLYYNKAIEIEPDNYVAITNISLQLIQNGALEEAEMKLKQSRQIRESWPNTHFALGVLYLKRGNIQEAFAAALKALINHPKQDMFQQQTWGLIHQIAETCSDNGEGMASVNQYISKLERISGKSIQIQADDTIGTIAKLEIAENHDRGYHLIKHKSNTPGLEASIMHELVHLDFILEARAAGNNKLFTSSQNQLNLFKQKQTSLTKQLLREGLPEASANKAVESLFDGLNLQIYNTPIDLFIEDKLYKEYHGIRPIHFLAYHQVIKTGIQATTDPQIVKLFPKEVISKSKVLNMTLAMLFHELFGLDLLPAFKSDKQEMQTAKRLYEEFCEYRSDRNAGEEYEIIQHWGEDLELDSYFTLMEDQVVGDDIDDMLDKISNDPLDLKGDEEEKDQEREKFIKEQEELGLNMAVVMYMIDAMHYFEIKNIEQIRTIAFDIAMLGRQGFNPNQSGYRVPDIEKDFSGYHILAYYYVSWAIAIPEMLDKLDMPFEAEYALAQKMYKS